jgi:hypothetical protein
MAEEPAGTALTEEDKLKLGGLLRMVLDLMAKESAARLAGALLFAELASREPETAQRITRQLRESAAMPLGAGVAQAIEELAATWQEAADAER